jgi:single-strand DNA-binding protein
MNKVIVVGHVSKKGELIKTAKGTAILNINLATNERYRDNEGNVKQHTDFHALTLFGKHAESADRHVAVGTGLAVEGHLNYSEYEKEGQKHRRTSIIVDKYEFVGAKKKEGTTASDKSEKSVETAPEIKEGDQCPSCKTGTVKKKNGKNGGFWGCSNYPECRFIGKSA